LNFHFGEYKAIEYIINSKIKDVFNFKISTYNNLYEFSKNYIDKVASIF